MNKHFHDSRYYLVRAAEHAKLGLTESLEPYATRLRAALGREDDPEPEPNRLDAVRDEVAGLERNVSERARTAVDGARATLSRSAASSASPSATTSSRGASVAVAPTGSARSATSAPSRGRTR